MPDGEAPTRRVVSTNDKVNSEWGKPVLPTHPGAAEGSGYMRRPYNPYVDGMTPILRDKILLYILEYVLTQRSAELRSIEETRSVDSPETEAFKEYLEYGKALQQEAYKNDMLRRVE